LKLLIISNMSHYLRDSTIVGWGPTVQEIDQLATLFEEVRHLGCLHSETAPASALPYRSSNVTFLPLPPAGGSSLKDKLGILGFARTYLREIRRELPNADVVHVRCPANIPLFAIIQLALTRHPKRRWVKYAGNWRPEGREAWSYRFQRWWLQRNLHRGLVTINGEWPDQPPHVHSFVNPCLSEEELQEGRRLAENKVMQRPVRLLFVGNLSTAKGVHHALKALRLALDRNAEICMEFIGDGPERPAFEQMARELNLCEVVQFHGWVPRSELSGYYGRAHLLLLPSRTEGWPKVLSEAMAFGVVPLASAVGSIPQYLAGAQTGRAIPAEAVERYADAILDYSTHPDLWKKESLHGLTAAERFSYRSFLEAVRSLLDLPPANPDSDSR
jgi:glycosyltransferase involved in cell wall biosynthesis